MTSQHGQCRNIDSSFQCWVFPIPATPPYSARPLRMHGATGCGRYKLRRLKALVLKPCKVVRGTSGRTWRRDSWRAGVSPKSWPALAAQVARLVSKRRGGTERRRAPNLTRTVVWRTGAPKVMENITYFEHSDAAPKMVPTQGAPNVTLTDVS